MSPIAGLTDKAPSFKELGRLRLGISKDEMKGGGPKEIGYFRPDFRPDATDALQLFVLAYGKEPDAIRFRLPFPEINRSWDANYEVYNKAGLLGMADGKRWLYLRHNHTGELLVKDGVPMNIEHTLTGEDGQPYLPFDAKTPVYSYRSGRGEDVPVYASPTGRLKILIPELMRAAYVLVITRSIYNVIHISEQLSAIELVAREFGMNITSVPMLLTRRREKISVSINGQKSMQDKYLLNIEVEPAWMQEGFGVLHLMTPTKRSILQGFTLPELPAPEIENGDDEDGKTASVEGGDEQGFFLDDEPQVDVPVDVVDTTGGAYQEMLTIEKAENVVNRDGVRYGDLDSEKLSYMYNNLDKTLQHPETLSVDAFAERMMKRDAIKLILADREVKLRKKLADETGATL